MPAPSLYHGRMELYERIKTLASALGLSISGIAMMCGVKPATFHRWMNGDSQRNIYAHLPQIVARHPEVRPEWLYYGDEPMLKKDKASPPNPLESKVQELEQENSALREEVAKANALIRKLTEKLLEKGES